MKIMKIKTLNIISNLFNNKVLNTILIFMSILVVLSTMLIVEYKFINNYYSYWLLFIVLLTYFMLILNIFNKFDNLLNKLLSTSSVWERLILSYLISYIVLNIFLILISNTYIITNDILLTMSSNPVSGTNTPDPVRFWPSGTTQSWGILAGALGVYRAFPGSPRAKAIAGLATIGVTAPSALWFHAVENPNGFERVMYSFSEYKRTGRFPNPNNVKDVSVDELTKNINENLVKEVKEAEKLLDINVNVNVSDSLTVGSTSTTTGTGASQSLMSNLDFSKSLDELYSILNDSIINNVLNFFSPVEVTGHLDSLLGVQLVLYFSIFIMTISVSLLLILHLLVNIFMLNKDRILNRFNNKIVRFYIKYQTILAYISFYILPIIMLLGLLSISLASYHLITHPIPYENMNIDLHQYIHSNKSDVK